MLYWGWGSLKQEGAEGEEEVEEKRRKREETMQKAL